MIQLAIWYLKKRGVQLILNIEFIGDTSIKNKRDKVLYIHDVDGDNLYIGNK